MTDYLRLDIGEHSPTSVAVVIEIPKYSTNKYEYDKKRASSSWTEACSRRFTTRRINGFVPQTLAEDGDPLDILVLGETPTFRGLRV